MERLSELSLDVRGERVVLRGDRSLYWPRESLLAVADLHVGKTESLRQRGVALPHGVMQDDLSRLGRALEQTGAHRLLVLGDLVHDRSGLTPAVRASFAQWRERFDVGVGLVLGNHDAHIEAWPAEWGLTLHGERLAIAPFDFVHDAGAASREAPPGPAAFEWSGHVHPVVTMRRGPDRLRLPCFAVGDDRALLPAFSRLTGGLDVPVDSGARLVVVAEGFVVPLPASR